MRLVQTQVWPAFLNLQAIAPSTALSRSASSKTMNGAWPPSSIEVRLTVSAHCLSRILPTSVEPVNETLRTVLLVQSSVPIGPALPVTTLNTPPGTPARSASSARARARVGGGAGGLDHHGAAGGQGRADLAGDHRDREVPGRDRGAHAHGLLQHQDPARGHGLRDDVAVDPLGFLGEPLEERGAVGDLALGLGQRLALLAGHQEGEVVGVGHDQLEPAAQDGRPLLGGLRPPGRQRALGRLDRAPGLGDADAGHGADGLAGGRVGDLDRLAVRRRRSRRRRRSTARGTGAGRRAGCADP